MLKAPHNSNFAFLAEHDERLAKIGFEAEQLASISPTACMMQVRLLAELLAKETAAYVGVDVDEDASFYEVLMRLERESAFSDDIDDLFHDVRMNANDVVHGEVYLGDSRGVAMNYLRVMRRIAIWFHQSFGRDRDFSAGPFVEPPDLASQRQRVLSENRNLQQAVDDAQKAVGEANKRALHEKHRRGEAEELLAELREERNVFQSLAEEYEARLVVLRAQADAAGSDERLRRHDRMREASHKLDLDERESRAVIDTQLRQLGWRADTEALRWDKGTRPDSGTSIAIADVPTAAGRADYVLFDGPTALAIIEARPWHEPARDGLAQARRHSRAWDRALSPPAGSPWVIDGVEFEIPFVFASNGREFQNLRDSHHGIWFGDLRGGDDGGRALAGWYSPKDLQRLLVESSADCQAG